MIGGLLGAFFLIAILCIVAYVIVQIMAQAGASFPPFVSAIVWAVIAIVCLIVLARGLGVAIPGL